MKRLATFAVAMGLVGSGLIASPVVSQASTGYAEVSFSEIPNAVVVADDGTMAVSLFDEKAVALVTASGQVAKVSLDCSPADVAIAPDATYAWAVCQGSSHLYVIDVPQRQFTVADAELVSATDIEYLPQLKQLVIADLSGSVVVVSAKSLADYQVLSRTPTSGFSPAIVAPLASGTGTYVATDAGQLLWVDFGTGRVQNRTQQGVLLLSLVLSRSQTLLYAGAVIGQEGVDRHSSLVSLDPVTGVVREEVQLNYTFPGTTTMNIAAGFRTLAVSTGLAITLAGEETGLFNVALDEQGAFGAFVATLSTPAIGADVSVSENGTRLAAADTNGHVHGLTVSDEPYPSSLGIAARIKGKKLKVSGTSAGLRPGTVVTVMVKNLTKKKPTFKAQRVTATIDASGAYRWSSKAPSKRLKVFTVSGSVKSANVKCQPSRKS